MSLTKATSLRYLQEAATSYRKRKAADNAPIIDTIIFTTGYDWIVPFEMSFASQEFNHVFDFYTEDLSDRKRKLVEEKRMIYFSWGGFWCHAFDSQTFHTATPDFEVELNSWKKACKEAKRPLEFINEKVERDTLEIIFTQFMDWKEKCKELVFDIQQFALISKRNLIEDDFAKRHDRKTHRVYSLVPVEFTSPLDHVLQ